MKKILLVTIGLFSICLVGSQTWASSRGIVRVKTSTGATREIRLYSGYHALVIGVGDYKNGWPKLRHAVNDARDVAKMLRRQGWKVDLLENPDGNRLEDSLNGLIIGPGKDKDKAVLVWYSGHGHTLEEAGGTSLGYIVPVDAPLPSRNELEFMRKAIDMRKIETVLRRIRSKHVLMIFDSCFSGSIFNINRAAPSDFIQEKVAEPVRQIITAGNENEQVPDRSVFKTVFLQGIEKGYADRNADGYVTGEELGAYIEEKVINYSRKAQHPQFGKINDPKLDKGDFVFQLASSGAVIEQPSTQTRLKIDSNVSGASIYLDGNRIGSTPLPPRMVTPGEHRIRVEKDGYETYQKRVSFEHGRTVSMYIDLSVVTPRTGRLYVNTNPSDARIRILNIKPKFLQGMELDAGKYLIETSAEGYETKTLWITLASHEDKTVEVTLQKAKPKKGRLFVSTDPPNARVKFLNLNRGYYSGMELPAGRYHLEISASQYETKEEWLQIENEEEQRISVRLKQKEPQPGDTWTEPVTGMEFVWVPGGCYQMGSYDGDNDERPVHEVCVDGFWMGKYEVTQVQWERVMGNNPSRFKKGNNYPVERVSWHDAKEFIRKLNTGGFKFRLPTEAEWEYAARSGGKREMYSGGNDVNRVAWYVGNSGMTTHSVGTKAANGLGLYDMSGNVWEWCEDSYGDYSSGSVTNPRGPYQDGFRVLRGGSWGGFARNARSAFRFRRYPDFRYSSFGFRVSRRAEDSE